MKRLPTFLLILALSLLQVFQVFACDEAQSETYVTEILFGDQAAQYDSDEDVALLLEALYLCSEQHDNQGAEKLALLKKQRIGVFTSISSVNVSQNALMKCSHGTWEYEYSEAKKAQSNRKNILKRTVNKVLNFGLTEGKKSDSFTALMYYTHILADYLADDPDATDAKVKGKTVSSYSGQAFVELNGNRPTFTKEEKSSLKTYSQYSSLDSLGRSGAAVANISTDNMAPADSRQSIGSIKPSGWETVKYPGYVNSSPAYLYNRCHLIAHQLNNNDTAVNLITGTRYLNIDGMKPFEDRVASYIKSTGNHVLYRATPIYEGDNLLASGVQLEAYSVEDKGKGICFNVYCYNVQPGISIDYTTGKSEIADEIYEEDGSIPFAVLNPSDSDPDLIYEVNKHLSVLFEGQKNTSDYMTMMSEIDTVANDARAVGDKGEKPARRYIALKKYEYKYFETLKTYVPRLLKREKFFKKFAGI